MVLAFLLLLVIRKKMKTLEPSLAGASVIVWGCEPKIRLLEPCAGKLACTVLTGGKSEKTYLSEFGRGLYYGSYQNPRTLVWGLGTVIFLLMIITAFLGYVFSLYRCNISLYSNESTLCLTLPTIVFWTF